MLFTPRNYQTYAADRIINEKAVGLFLEPGLGKTASTLLAIRELILERYEVDKALVVAPLRVAETVWQEEAQKWDQFRALRVVKVLGDPKQRDAAIRKQADVYVCSITNFYWLVEWCKRVLGYWPFDMVVFDELSKFKDPSTLLFRTAREVRKRPGLKRVVGLTGTPMSNGSDDLWSQIYLLDKGERLGETVTKFRLQYYLPGDRKGYVVYNWVPLPDTVDKITAKISDICVSMKQEDWLELPDFIPIMRRVELPDEAREAYREVLREAYARLRDGSEITAATAGVVTGKLQQIANGSVYDADREVHGLHTAKQEQLEAILEESAALGEHVLVYYAYQHDLGSIMYAAREYKTQVLRGPANVAAWNAGEIEVLIAHPDSAGHGLNLQDGGHVIVWYGLTWSLEKYLQANARLHRQGQKSPVRAYHIIGAKTVDERIMRLLEARKEGLDYVQAVLKAEIKEMDE